MNKHIGSTLGSLFEELGELDEVNALAAKKLRALRWLSSTATKARRDPASNRRRIVGSASNETQRR